MFGGSKGTNTGFTFGSTSTTTNGTTAGTQGAAKPLFSFGNTTTSSAITTTTQSSGFSFGSTSKPLLFGGTAASGGTATNVASNTGATTGFSFGSTTNKGTGSIFGSTFGSPSTTANSGFTFGAKPAVGSGGLFGTPTTTSSLAAATTTTAMAPANTTASIFSSSLGVGAKPSSLFANLTSPTATATPATTPNAQLGGGLLFGTVPTTATNTGSVGTTTSMAPFSFGTPTSSSQPSGSLFGLATAQPAVSAAPTIGASTSSLFGQKSTSGGLFGQVAATTPSTIPTTGSLFSTSTIAKSTFASPSAIGTAATPAATTTTTVAAPVLSFGFNTAAPTTGTTAPSLFGSAVSSLTSTSTAPTVAFQSTASMASPQFAGLFGTKTASVTTSATGTTSMSELSGTAAPSLTTTTSSAVLSFGSTGTTPASFNPAATSAFTFGSSALTPASSALQPLQPAVSMTSAASTLPLFQATPATAVPSVPTNGFAFGQLAAAATTTTTTVAAVAAAAAVTTTMVTTASLPIITSFLQSTTTTSAVSTTSTVTSAGSALPSLLYPSKTTALPSSASITTTTSTITSSALASIVPAAPTISPDKPITFAQLEQLINRLALDVETQQRVFMSQVLELNAFDRVLRGNQQKVLDISEEIKQLEEEKDRFLHTVDFISQQQAELEALVVDLEKALGLSDWTEMTPIGLPDPGVATHADMQRQAMLQLQLRIDAQLKQADDDITDIIEQVKELQRSAVGLDDEAESAEQIAQILRRQLDALQWIDEQSCDLKKKVTKLSEGLSMK